MPRSIPLFLTLGFFFLIVVLFPPRANAANGLACWVASFNYRNDTLLPDSVTVILKDDPLVHSYTSTETLQPGEDRFVSVHGFVTAGGGVSAEGISPTLTFVDFGDFKEVPYSVCMPVSTAVPSLGVYSLMMLASLLAGLGLLVQKRRQSGD